MAEFNLSQSHKLLEVTNGHFFPVTSAGVQAGMELGCTGSIELEPEMRAITRKCEGRVSDEVSVTDFYTLNFTGHLNIDVARAVFGLTNEGLKPGVWAIGKTSRPQKGIFTWEAIDMHGEMKKFIALTNVVVSSGYTFSHENGGDEVAEVEVEFKAMIDDLGNFYYEAFEDEIAPEIASAWTTNFNLDLVSASGTVVTP